MTKLNYEYMKIAVLQQLLFAIALAGLEGFTLERFGFYFMVLFFTILSYPLIHFNPIPPHLFLMVLFFWIVDWIGYANSRSEENLND